MSGTDEITWYPHESETDIELSEEIKRRLEWAHVRITRGDLEKLDKIIIFMDALAGTFSADFYSDVWNLRNGMVPFQPGDEHYDED